MRAVIHRRAVAAAFVFLGVAAAGAEEVWCEACGDWVFRPHDKVGHADPATGEPVRIEFCETCDAWVPSPHVRHLSEPEEGGDAGDGAPAAVSPPRGASASDDWVSRYLPWLAAAAAAVFVLAAVLSALLRTRGASAARRKRRRPFPMVRGEPQGLALMPGRLVCEKEGIGDGGLSTGHRAMIRFDGKWTPAFVKRMVGGNLRPDQRFPALQYEADILRHLEGTGVVPRVFVPPTVTDAAGETWSYFAMSEAPGRPWPKEGGFERIAETRRALSALCASLVALHERNVGHYDLKPQNIFWEPKKGLATLIDFGSAVDHEGVFVNPLAGQRPGTVPWIPPTSDGRLLADLTPASDAWVYGLIFCEALVGGIANADRTARRWFVDPKRIKPERLDREWFREALAKSESPAIAEAVVDGLFAPQASVRMSIDGFLGVLRKEWGS